MISLPGNETKDQKKNQLHSKQALRASEGERYTGWYGDILGLALAELDVSVNLRHVSDLDRFVAVTGNRYRRELTLEPLLGPGPDVLVFPMPVGGGVGHGLDDGHSSWVGCWVTITRSG